jgi:hypothetical protein
MHILHLQLNEGSKYVIPITLSKHVTHLPPRKGNKYAIPITLSEHVSHLQPRKGSKYAIPVILSKHVSHLYSSKGNKHAIPITLSKTYLQQACNTYHIEFSSTIISSLSHLKCYCFSLELLITISSFDLKRLHFNNANCW